MKRCFFIFFLAFMMVSPLVSHSQPVTPFDKLFERWGPRIHPSDLRVLQLDMFRIRYGRDRECDSRQSSPTCLTIQQD